MPPKQLENESYLGGGDGGDMGSSRAGMSTPPKDRWAQPESPIPAPSFPVAPLPASALQRRRSADGASPRSPAVLQGNGGFLFGSSKDPFPPDENDDDWEQNSISSSGHRSVGVRSAAAGDSGSRSPRTARGVLPIHRTASSPSFSRSPGSRSRGAKAVPFRVFVLLLRPRDKIFELIQVEYDPSRATVGDVLDLVPASATEPKLGNQRHIGLMRTADGAVLSDLNLPASPSVFSADGATANVSRGDILVAIPEGYTGDKCQQLSDKILRNPKMVRLLKRKDPLKPKRRSDSGRSTGSASSGGSSVGSKSSVGGRSETSSVGSFKRRGSRRVACVPPTVMEEVPELESPAQDKPAKTTTTGAPVGSPSGNASVSMHSVETKSVRNTGGLPTKELDAIAELLSQDNEHEKRHRREEERARADAEERKRLEAEARTKAEAEERIRGEIERKARERAEEERRKREEEAEAAAAKREEEERKRRAREEEEEKIAELSRRAEAAEREWERVVRADSTDELATATTTTPPSSSPRRSSLASPPAAARAAAAPYPEEIEFSADPSPSAGGNKGGLEMFVFGMISSAVAVALAARAINGGHPQVVVVERTSSAQEPAQHQAQQAQAHHSAAAAVEDDGIRRKIAYIFAVFVILQVCVMVLLRNDPARRFCRKWARKVVLTLRGVRRKRPRAGSEASVGSPKMRRNMSSHSLANTKARPRSTLVAATQAAARRSDYGYGSGGGSNWRKAANL